MRRDTTEFRNRFLKWKNGELVYENGLVSASYQDGRESSYTKLVIEEQKANNERERNIAKSLVHNPSLPNLFKSAYHWYKSVPFLGGQSEVGIEPVLGTPPDIQGIKNVDKLIKVAKISKAIDSATKNYKRVAFSVKEDAEYLSNPILKRMFLEASENVSKGVATDKDRRFIESMKKVINVKRGAVPISEETKLEMLTYYGSLRYRNRVLKNVQNKLTADAFIDDALKTIRNTPIERNPLHPTFAKKMGGDYPLGVTIPNETTPRGRKSVIVLNENAGQDVINHEINHAVDFANNMAIESNKKFPLKEVTPSRFTQNGKPYMLDDVESRTRAISLDKFLMEHPEYTVDDAYKSWYDNFHTKLSFNDLPLDAREFITHYTEAEGKNYFNNFYNWSLPFIGVGATAAVASQKGQSDKSKYLDGKEARYNKYETSFAQPINYEDLIKQDPLGYHGKEAGALLGRIHALKKLEEQTGPIKISNPNNKDGSVLKKKLYKILYNSGGIVPGFRDPDMDYTGSYWYNSGVEDVKKRWPVKKSSKYAGRNAVSQRNLLDMYVYKEPTGLKYLRDDSYVLGGDTLYNGPYYEGKIYPVGPDSVYNITKYAKPFIDSLISKNLTIPVNLNNLPLDRNRFPELILDNVRHSKLKPVVDEKGNYYFKASKLWDLKGSLTYGNLTDKVNSLLGGGPFVLELKIPIKWDNDDLHEYSTDWNYIKKTIVDPNNDTGYKYGKESGIHIKPSHRGRLTALKKRTGKSEAELYKNGSAAVRKMITFSRNARKWKH